jgi:hypothetical protein
MAAAGNGSASVFWCPRMGSPAGECEGGSASVGAALDTFYISVMFDLVQEVLTLDNEEFLYDKAVAFHYRLAEREGWVAWQPSQGRSCVHETLPIVVLKNNGDWRAVYAYSYSREPSPATADPGRVRFREIETRKDKEVDAAERAAIRVWSAREKGKTPNARDLQRLLDFGLSYREVGELAGVSRQRILQLVKDRAA